MALPDMMVSDGSDSIQGPASDPLHTSARAIAIGVRDRVWWSDVDKMGVMFFGRYVRFAEMAETEFFRAVGYSFDDIHAQFAIWLARVRLEIDFRCPAKLDDELICRAELVKVGAASMYFRFPLDRVSDGRRIADIVIVIACLDATTLKSTRTPTELRNKLRPHIKAQASR